MAKKKIVNKALTFGLCATLAFGQVPAVALAEELSENEQVDVENAAALDDQEPVAEDGIFNDITSEEPVLVWFSAEDELGLTDEELFAGYVEQTLYEPLYGEIATFGNFGESRLNTLEKFFYRHAKTLVEQVAAGRQDMALVTFSISSAEAEAEMGKPYAQLTAKEIQDALEQVFYALLTDCPYDLYWFDKTTGMACGYAKDGRLLGEVSIGFEVADTYKGNATGLFAPYSVNTAITSAASQTVSRAQAVVSQYAALPDYEKIVAYKDWVCDQVTYNYGATNGGVSYGDPWQIIYVFDNNPNTNVVCEGYAKAFQYLCDLSSFQSTSTQSYLVDGFMGNEAHMWNVVTLTGANGAANYLVDLTNTDGDGAGDKTGVFLSGALGGSIADGYTFKHNGGRNLVYTFDDTQKALYGTDASSILNLSFKDYAPLTTTPEQPSNPGTDTSKPTNPGTNPSTPGSGQTTPSTPSTDPTPGADQQPTEPQKPETPSVTPTPDTPDVKPTPEVKPDPSKPTPEQNNPAVGWVQKGATWYYLDGSGAATTGWSCIGNTWYYFDTNGQMQTGWLKLGNTWYYLNNSGAMATGWQSVGGVWYYLNGSGAMQTGWLNLGNTWYYLNGSGAMQTGWLRLGGTWYYLNGSGAMATGWKNVGNAWYYFNTSGAMATGWKQIGGSWYYLSGSGAMLTGWQWIGGAWYYFYGSGVMAANTTIGGYRLSASGAMV